MFRKPLISRLDLAVLIGITLSVLLSNIAVFGQRCNTVRADVVRLHIMANSNAPADQQLKLRVRDRILAEVGEVFSTPHSQADAKTLAQAQLPRIEAAAREELRASGVDLPVKAEVCNMYFTTRQYEELSLPAGKYDAVRVTLGSGGGKNWWCVMYPPICVPAASEETAEALANSPELEEIETLNNEPLFVPKLAVVELFEGWFSDHTETASPKAPSSEAANVPPPSEA